MRIDLILQHFQFQFPFFGFRLLTLFQKKLNLCHHTVDIVGQEGEFIISLIMDTFLHITVGDGLAGFYHLIDRAGDT